MSEKIGTRTEDRLLEARRESLHQLNESNIRPHGKLWGMDVFSWFNPTPSLIANTLHSFPFPAIWIGNGSVIAKALKEDDLLLSNLSAVISYDSSIFNLENKWLDQIKNCVGTQSVDEAFEFLKMVKAPQTILMFTATGENWEERKKEFEDFLKLVQV
ncbi:MAG: hypothetical protein E6Q38_03625 [Crocinitomicaceae bacterium]|nr:MAG: hypothetical protein E6Q38_03625 [Crocinitomicaceae bacterium]